MYLLSSFDVQQVVPIAQSRLKEVVRFLNVL